MGTATLADFQADLIQASGNRALDVPRMNRWINNAQAEFGYAFQFPELQRTATIVTVQGSNNYPMPADFRATTEDGIRLISPQNRAGGILESESRSNFLRSDRYPAVASQGAVGSYHMFGKKIWVRPTPDSTVMTIQFDYWAKIAPLAAAGDKSVFDDDWDDIIFRGALYRLHLSYGEHDRMINVFNLFLAGIRSRVMAEDLQEFPEGGISMIQSQMENLVR